MAKLCAISIDWLFYGGRGRGGGGGGARSSEGPTLCSADDGCAMSPNLTDSTDTHCNSLLDARVGGARPPRPGIFFSDPICLQDR